MAESIEVSLQHLGALIYHLTIVEYCLKKIEDTVQSLRQVESLVHRTGDNSILAHHQCIAQSTQSVGQSGATLAQLEGVLQERRTGLLHQIAAERNVVLSMDSSSSISEYES